MNEMDRAFNRVMKQLESGKLYRDYLRDLKKMGLDPNKPLELTFADGHIESTLPLKDMMPHLKPRKDP
jgi:hypothetical protein